MNFDVVIIAHILCKYMSPFNQLTSPLHGRLALSPFSLDNKLNCHSYEMYSGS